MEEKQEKPKKRRRRRCIAKTDKGTRCSRNARIGNYCTVHWLIVTTGKQAMRRKPRKDGGVTWQRLK